MKRTKETAVDLTNRGRKKIRSKDEKKHLSDEKKKKKTFYPIATYSCFRVINLESRRNNNCRRDSPGVLCF